MDLNQLLAKDAIRELMAKYVWYADHMQFDDLAQLFVPEGTFTPKKVDGTVWLTMKGQADIAQSITASVQGGEVVHHLFSYEIDILTAETAKGVFNMEDIFRRKEGAPLPEDASMAFKSFQGFGHYHGDFVKVDGAWRIKALVQTRLRMDFEF